MTTSSEFELDSLLNCRSGLRRRETLENRTCSRWSGLVERREVNQQNLSLLVNKAVTFVEEMQRQIESDPNADTMIKQPKTLIHRK